MENLARIMEEAQTSLKSEDEWYRERAGEFSESGSEADLED